MMMKLAPDIFNLQDKWLSKDWFQNHQIQTKADRYWLVLRFNEFVQISIFSKVEFGRIQHIKANSIELNRANISLASSLQPKPTVIKSL